MTEQDYIDLISFCEKEEEYPDFDSNHITMDKWNYDEWGYGEIDQGSVQEQWNEVDYFMDEDM